MVIILTRPICKNRIKNRIYTNSTIFLFFIAPKKSDEINQNLRTLLSELNTLDQDIQKNVSALKTVELAANHPAYNYFAQHYALNIHSFDFSPDTPLTETEKAAFMAWYGEGQSDYLLWEEMRSDEVKQSFPQQIQHVHMDPLEQPLEGKVYDYVAQMKSNIQRLAGIK